MYFGTEQSPWRSRVPGAHDVVSRLVTKSSPLASNWSELGRSPTIGGRSGFLAARPSPPEILSESQALPGGANL